MTNEEYSIRSIIKEDVEKVVSLVTSSFEKEYLISSIYRGKGIEKFISNELDNQFSPYRYFILCHDNEIAGYVEFKIFESTSTAFLNIIAISNDYKQKGIGSKLFDFSRIFFSQRGFNSIQLDVYVTNTVALNWYLSLGFEQKCSNLFYKIGLDVKNQKPNQIHIQNYAQYKEMHKIFGFYFLDVTIASENIRLGTIEKDLFVRGVYTQSLREQLLVFSKELEFENLYFIGSYCEFEECKFMNEIIRMVLNTKL
jgi:N-acetylglutamate synthase-like GNAT family acetyltransferase